MGAGVVIVLMKAEGNVKGGDMGTEEKGVMVS